jgi:hypothetical protein
MQYVSVKFNNGWRLYTYRNPFEPVKVGARVEINTRDGNKILRVLAVTDAAPAFQTKPIKRII